MCWENVTELTSTFEDMSFRGLACSTWLRGNQALRRISLVVKQISRKDQTSVRF